MQIKIDIDFSITPRAKRALKWIAVPFAVFAGTIAVAHAYDTTWIRASQPVSATSLKSNLDEIQSRLLALEQPLGSVTSNASGAERIERARINGSTIVSQSGSWLVSASGGISQLLTITTGEFSAVPTCTITPETPARSCSVNLNPPTATGLWVNCYDLNGSNVGAAFSILCIGPR